MNGVAKFLPKIDRLTYNDFDYIMTSFDFCKLKQDDLHKCNITQFLFLQNLLTFFDISNFGKVYVSMPLWYYLSFFLETFSQVKIRVLEAGSNLKDGDKKIYSKENGNISLTYVVETPSSPPTKK